MTLKPGSSIGPYEILAAIGKGGMGEVYRARDTKLKRDVAIKSLPEAFARDPDRLARFQREAETLAALNHPNIGAIYGVEESDGGRLLVLELVEGETLADRIARGPIRVDDALAIARQITEALEAAHEKGIIHRDLKPANVKVLPDGKVKVLDFGLAKAMESGSANAGLSNSPTLSMAATGAGVILGTASYMSPEQAKGRTVDKRTDIFAFGCVLYEMLAGARAFDGEDLTQILARVLEREPDWTRLPPGAAAAAGSARSLPGKRSGEAAARCRRRQTRHRARAEGAGWRSGRQRDARAQTPFTPGMDRGGNPPARWRRQRSFCDCSFSGTCKRGSGDPIYNAYAGECHASHSASRHFS